MKIRTDFVTNSSSSSFVLAFKDANDFNRFVSDCKEWNYKEIANLIKRLRDKEEMSDDACKEKAMADIKHWMSFEFQRAYVAEHLPDKNTLPFSEQCRLEDELLASEDYRIARDEFLSHTNFAALINKIQESEFVVSGTIWDSNGGILEYAIRNGILHTLRPWFVYQEDIG